MVQRRPEPLGQARLGGRHKQGSVSTVTAGGFQPALVVWHQEDHCSLSPPAGSATLFALIPSHGKATRAFEHGHSVATDPCGAFSEHGYAGIEEEVVKKIAEFIRGKEAD